MINQQIISAADKRSAVWRPILSSESNLATLAWDSIHAITQAVLTKDYIPTTKNPLLDYTSDEALLYAYLAVVHNDLEWAQRATERLNLAIEQASKGSGYLGLYGGLTGLGWAVEHISQLLEKISTTDSSESSEESTADETEEDLNADVDAMVIHNLPRMDATSPYDLISGLVGFGVYFLERLPKESAARGVNAVFNQLEQLSQRDSYGITWYSGPDLLPDWQRQICPLGYYNLGVAHGIPGIIHLLSEISTKDIVDAKRSHRLLEESVNWLIAHARPAGSNSWFSSWFVPGTEPADGRMAWCYGDLGILAVLQQVARRADRSDWRKFANELLDHCLSWPVETTGMGDAPLCHGSVGAAQIFNRIYQIEGDPRCRDAAVLWYERALAMRQPTGGIGGYSSLTRPDPDGPIIWEPSPAFLDGAIGIALAFLSAVSPVEPAWDRMLLLSGKE